AEVLEQEFGTTLERLPVLVIDPHLADCDAPLGRKEPQEPRDVFMDTHSRAAREINKGDAISHRQPVGGFGHASLRTRHHYGVVTGRLDDAPAADQPQDPLALPERMT